MFENLKIVEPNHENHKGPEQDENIAALDKREELKNNAPAEAVAFITEHGLEADVSNASPEEVSALVEKLPGLIKELSFEEGGKLKNENRYLAKALSMYLEKAKRQKEADEIELPLAA